MDLFICLGWFGMQNQTNEELLEDLLQKKKNKNKQVKESKQQSNCVQQTTNHLESSCKLKADCHQSIFYSPLHSHRSVTSLKKEIYSITNTKMQQQDKNIWYNSEGMSKARSRVFDKELPSYLAIHDDDDDDEELFRKTLSKFLDCAAAIRNTYNTNKKKSMKKMKKKVKTTKDGTTEDEKQTKKMKTLKKTNTSKKKKNEKNMEL